MKRYLKYDDTLDAFGIHGVGGFVGNILTGVFAAKWVAALDGATIPGGAIDGNGIAIGYAFVSAVSIAAWSFVVTMLILFCINIIPGLRIRSSQELEVFGGDWGEMGELEQGATILQPQAVESLSKIGQALTWDEHGVSVGPASTAVQAPRLRTKPVPTLIEK